MGREVVVRAATLRQTFAEAVGALLALSVNPETVEAKEIREVRAHGTSLEALLAHWIGECCYVLDVEGYRCRSIDLAVFDVERKTGAEPLRLHAFLHGESIDPTRHEPPGAIAPLGLEDISITPVEGAYEIRLTIDRSA